MSEADKIIPIVNTDLKCDRMVGLCNKHAYCFLSAELTGQAVNGGYQDSDSTVPAGPYWLKSTWERYVNKLNLAAKNCPKKIELTEQIQLITSKKQANNELL